MMAGPMPVRGPGQGPRGTGAGLRGPLTRNETYGKFDGYSLFWQVTLRLHESPRIHNFLFNYYYNIISIHFIRTLTIHFLQTYIMIFLSLFFVFKFPLIPMLPINRLSKQLNTY
jgi:hypothetical protein